MGCGPFLEPDDPRAVPHRDRPEGEGGEPGGRGGRGLGRPPPHRGRKESHLFGEAVELVDVGLGLGAPDAAGSEGGDREGGVGGEAQAAPKTGSPPAGEGPLQGL